MNDKIDRQKLRKTMKTFAKNVTDGKQVEANQLMHKISI